MDIGIFNTDSNKESNGVWRPCGNARILVASAHSERYKSTFRRLLLPHEAALSLNVADEKVLASLEIEAIAETILLGWEGFEEDGQVIPFTAETALRWLKTMPRFLDFVKAEANKMENFRKVKESAEVKNSEPVSVGS